MPLTIDEFIAQVISSRLMSQEEIADFRRALPADKPWDDLQDFVRQLVRQNKLTAHQATVAYRGKAHTLLLDNYIVLDKLGQGGMGLVFKARHRNLNRIVALKVLPASSTGAPDAVKRFHREVQAAARLSHPNIVAAFDAGESNRLHFLVMEFVDGSDLSQVVKKQGPLPVETALQCIVQAARGLEAAHAAGIIHRDIKPANLLLDKEGVVKILDMGLARIDEGLGAGNAGAGLTQTGAIMGTVDYISPEQAMDTKKADQRADIYSLGCSLHYLLTGRPVYEGETLMIKLLAHREQPVPSLRAQQPDVPPWLDAVFAKMIAKKPADRFQTVTELLSALSESSTVEPAGKSSGLQQLASAPETDDEALLSFLRAQGGQVAAATAAVAPAIAVSASASASTINRTPLSSTIHPIAGAASTPLGRKPKQRKNTAVAAGMVGLGLALLVGFVTFSGGRQGGGATRVKAFVAKAAIEAEAVDLLPLVDVQRNTVLGQWSVVDQKLVSPSTGPACISIPVVPPPEYEIRLRVVRMGRPEAISVGIPVGRQQVEAQVDGYNGNYSGFQSVNGDKINAPDNPTSFKGQVLDIGKPQTIVITVRSTGLSIAVDGREIVTNSGSGVLRAEYARGNFDPKQLYISTWTGFEIDKLELKPLGGASVDWRPEAFGEAWRFPLPGLVGRPAKLPDIRRWQVETVAPRGELYAVSLTPDGRTLACAGQSGTIRLYHADASQLKLKKLLFVTPQRVYALAWNAAGTRLAAGEDRSLRVWRADGSLEQTIPNISVGEIRGLAWSPDGRQIAVAGTGNGDRRLRVWRLDGTFGPEFNGHTKNVQAVAWSPDGKQFASASEDHTVRVWNIDGTLAALLQGHDKTVSGVVWSSTGQIATAGYDNNVRFWRADGTVGPVVQGLGMSLRGLAWTSDGKTLAVGGNGNVRLVSADGTPGPLILNVPGRDIRAVSWSADGKRLACAGMDGLVGVWNQSGEPILLHPHRTLPKSLAWRFDGSRLAAGNDDRSLRFWTDDGRQQTVVKEVGGPLRGLAWGPDGHQIAGIFGGAGRIWDEHGLPGTVLSGKSFTSVGWSPDGTHIATGHDDGLVRLWDPVGHPGEEFRGHEKQVTAVGWNRDKQLVSGSNDKTVRIWTSGGSTPRVQTLSDPVSTMVWSPDGKQYAVAADRKVLLFGAAQKLEQTLKGQTAPIQAIAWSPDSRRLVSASRDGSLVVWNAADGQAMATLLGHTSEVNTVAWCQGKLASAGMDCTIRGWDPDTGESLWSAAALSNGESVTFSDDGRLTDVQTDIEQKLVYVIENDKAEIELLTPREFTRRAPADFAAKVAKK